MMSAEIKHPAVAGGTGLEPDQIAALELLPGEGR